MKWMAASLSSPEAFRGDVEHSDGKELALFPNLGQQVVAPSLFV
jgi:hypothetical protein